MDNINFDKMVQKFLKTSKEKIRDAQREHTQRDRKNKKSDNAKRRKAAMNRRKNG